METDYTSLLKERLDQVAHQLGAGKDGPRWTHEVKLALAKLGQDFGWQTLATLRHPQPSDFGPEWLYDIVWCRKDGNGLTEIGLVAESEWDQRGVLHDFEKLLVAKAPIKLMVVQGFGKQIAQQFEICESAIRRFKGSHAGETYLLAGLDHDTLAFKFKLAA